MMWSSMLVGGRLDALVLQVREPLTNIVGSLAMSGESTAMRTGFTSPSYLLGGVK